MIGPLSIRDQIETRGRAMRLLHSAWLTRALRARTTPPLPRIPTRLVTQGGFAPLLATPEGRQWVADFWAQTLDNPSLQ